MAGGCGYIKLWRQVRDSKLWGRKPFSQGQAWIDLLLEAAWTERSVFVRGIEVQLEPGQLAVSECDLAERWGWSRGKVRRFLDEQENDTTDGTTEKPTERPTEAGAIVQQKSRVISVITVCNWSRYQGNGTTEPAQTGQQAGQQNETETGQQTVQQSVSPLTLPPLKDKKFKNTKKGGVGGFSEAFEKFWEEIPTRIGKGSAWRAWLAALKRGASVAEIMAGIEKYRRYESRRAGQAGYRPLHPATWLNQDRWADELPDLFGGVNQAATRAKDYRV
jgi:hypothetical protein